jgi:hypothetical protein
MHCMKRRQDAHGTLSSTLADVGHRAVQQLAQQSGQNFEKLLEAAFQQLAASGQLDVDAVLAAAANGSASAPEAPSATASGRGALNGQAAAAALRLVTNLPRAAPAASKAMPAPSTKAAAAGLGARMPESVHAAAHQC